jgi:tetratricopeptide (TPR) repeat protein
LFGEVAPFSAQHAAYMFFWVSVGHSIQYLWVTTYFAERAEHPTRRVPFYAKTILAGAAVFAVPALIFAPDIMGRYSLDGGLLVMISTVVNLHHYLLDAVIWKLRQGPIADVLIRSQAAQQDGLEPESGWVRTALVSVGVLSVLVMSLEMVSTRNADRAVAQRDAVALSRSIGILAMIQHPRASLYHSLAQIQKRRGDMTAAIESAERAQRLHYDFKYSSHLCSLLAYAGRMSEAIDVCRTIVNDRPDDSEAAMFLAVVMVRDPGRTAETVDEAIAIAEAASAARGDDPRFLEALASVYGAAGREDAKQRTAQRALEIATARNDQALVDKLQALIDTPESEPATE